MKNIQNIILKTITSISTSIFFTINAFAANTHEGGNIGHGSTTGSTAQQGSGFQSLIFLIIIVALFYFVLIRPQMKQNKDHKKMISEIKPGDEVLTSAGIIGKVKTLGENFVDLEISNEVTVKIQKQALSKVMPKGSLKTS